MAQTTYEVRVTGDGSSSVCVRSDDPTAIQEAIAWVQATAAEVQVAPPRCALHQRLLVRDAGRSGPFQCPAQDAKGGRCPYRRRTAA